ncbi:unnamed protein product [Mytilus edulis]|uniref:Mutator-like transposase domain-containing protein n=1 Tax=Mytilus edulis TaxID=6550 RepID=A0A8S3SFB5_MYTED|nr:unnamed protein product [Mytilus edulis]
MKRLKIPVNKGRKLPEVEASLKIAGSYVGKLKSPGKSKFSSSKNTITESPPSKSAIPDERACFKLHKCKRQEIEDCMIEVLKHAPHMPGGPKYKLATMNIVKRARTGTPGKGKEQPKHNCTRNWYGTSKAMEPDVGLSLVQNIEEKGCTVANVIMSDDTTTIARIRNQIDHGGQME